jgi:hypothetical protein
MDKFLGIYLNDQLALGVLWREVARRSQRNNSGTQLGEALAHVSVGIAEDVETFPSALGGGPGRFLCHVPIRGRE